MTTAAPLITTTPPTEVGLYLFYGVVRADDVKRVFRHKPMIQLVRVVHDSAGKLVRIGRDFFHGPESGITGSWMRLEVEELEERGLDVLHDAFAVDAVKRAQPAWRIEDGPWAPEDFRRLLTAQWGSFSHDSISDEDADDLTRRAVRLGLLAEEDPP